MNVGNLKRAAEIAHEVGRLERAAEKIMDTPLAISTGEILPYEVGPFADADTFRAFLRATKIRIEKRVDELKSEASRL